VLSARRLRARQAGCRDSASARLLDLRAGNGLHDRASRIGRTGTAERAFAAARAGPYFQNFVHVADILQLVVALLPEDRVPVVVNAFSDDTYEFDAPAELTRPKLGSSSQIVDESYAAEGREPVFLNRIAKRLHPAQHEEAG
jgi:hypothetical protein